MPCQGNLSGYDSRAMPRVYNPRVGSPRIISIPTIPLGLFSHRIRCLFSTLDLGVSLCCGGVHTVGYICFSQWEINGPRFPCRASTKLLVSFFCGGIKESLEFCHGKIRHLYTYLSRLFYFFQFYLFFFLWGLQFFRQ